MKLAIFGATGPTGRELVKQGLEQGHEITAFVRRPEAMSADARVRVIAGDATKDDAAIAEAVRGQDAVMSALGVRTSFDPHGLISESLGKITSAMQSAGVRRLMVVSAYGVGDSKQYMTFVQRLTARLLLGKIFADKHAAEQEVRRTDLEWTFFYPTLLTDGPLTGKYRVGERLDLSGIPKISRADVAHFILVELRERAYVRKVPVISY